MVRPTKSRRQIGWRLSVRRSESGSTELVEDPIYADEVVDRDLKQAARPLIEFPTGTHAEESDDWFAKP